MSGLKTCLATFALLGWFAASAHAQGVVPGGWAQQFGYQTMGGVAVGGGFAVSNGGPVFGGAVSPYGFGVSPYGNGFSSYGQGLPPYASGMGRPTYPGNNLYPNYAAPQMMNGTDPLIGVIRQSVRTSRRR